MVSDANGYGDIVDWVVVLILVLMEYGLGLEEKSILADIKKKS